MGKLNQNGNGGTDAWKVVKLAEGETAHTVRLPVGPLLVPLAVWKARRAELIRREYEHGWPLGVWLAADEGADAISSDIDDFTVIGIEFDRFSDGNGYATARALRARHGYTGELRALGDIPYERAAYRHEIGFETAAVVQPGRKTGAALAGPGLSVLHPAVNVAA